MLASGKANNKGADETGQLQSSLLFACNKTEFIGVEALCNYR